MYFFFLFLNKDIHNFFKFVSQQVLVFPFCLNFQLILTFLVFRAIDLLYKKLKLTKIFYSNLIKSFMSMEENSSLLSLSSLFCSFFSSSSFFSSLKVGSNKFWSLIILKCFSFFFLWCINVKIVWIINEIIYNNIVRKKFFFFFLLFPFYLLF